MTARPWFLPAGVFAVVLVAQLVLVALAGTDIPYQEQWEVEGGQLYPAWLEGTWRPVDLLRPHNEHRIGWTRALDLALFTVNGQWDPLVQLAAGAILRAAAAAILAGLLARGMDAAGQLAVAAGVAVAFLPHLAWQNALWGFQSQVYFALLFSIVALALLAAENPSVSRQIAGVLAGMAALLSMGAGLLVPWALLGLTTLRMIERRRVEWTKLRGVWPALVLLAVALALRREVPAHAALHPESAKQFIGTFAQAAAWPHVWTPVAALGLNAPFIFVAAARLAGRRHAVFGEDFILLLGGWAVAMAAAMAWTRGGGGEFDGGVPSRYADFLVLLPIANAWCTVRLAGEATARWRPAMRIATAAWGAFLVMGWLGLSTEVMRRLILPRMRDREAPVRLVVAFQRTGDAAVFHGQPLLYVPHPNLGAVQAVLADPRMHGRLPPSLQPGQPLGPLSRAVRTLLGRQ